MFKFKSSWLVGAMAVLLVGAAPAARAQGVDPSGTPGLWLPNGSQNHMVFVRKAGSVIGTGMLIGATRVVVPAHLVSGSSAATLTVTDIPVDPTASPAHIVSVASYTMHPSYNQTTVANDIAVIRLAAALPYTSTTIGAAGEPAPGPTIQGVGHMSYVAGTHPVQYQVLTSAQVTNLGITPNAGTIYVMPQTGYPSEKPCAIAAPGTLAPSAPLTVYGLFSYASQSPSYPMMFTRLSYFTSWINAQ